MSWREDAERVRSTLQRTSLSSGSAEATAALDRLVAQIGEQQDTIDELLSGEQDRFSEQAFDQQKARAEKAEDRVKELEVALARQRVIVEGSRSRADAIERAAALEGER